MKPLCRVSKCTVVLRCSWIHMTYICKLYSYLSPLISTLQITLHTWYVECNYILTSSTFPPDLKLFFHAHFTHLFVISTLMACHLAIDTNAVRRLKWEAEWRAKSCPRRVQTNGARTVGQLFNNGSDYLLQWVPSSRSSCQSHFKWPPSSDRIL